MIFHNSDFQRDTRLSPLFCESRDFSRCGLRSDGVLTAHEIAQCHTLDIELAYDPVQIGFVPVHVTDDITGYFSQHGRATWPVHGHRRLTFRRWQEADAPAFLSLLDNQRVWTYMPDPRPHLDLEAAVDLIALSNDFEHHDVFAAIVESGPAGQARLQFDLRDSQRSLAEISYWLGEAYWGRGLGSRLVAAFTRLSFERWPDLQTIVARVHPDNVASRRALLKSGYKPIQARAPDGWDWFAIPRGG